MFHKFGSVTAEKITIADWRKHVVGASEHQDPQQLSTVAEFELDPSNFLYVRARAVSAGEHHGQNQNGDYFPEDELKRAFRTFVHRGVYINHKSDDPAGAIGIILDAVWHDEPERKYVECLMAIDRKESIAHKIENGLAHSWSMGCMVKECECNICAKKATNEPEYCEHLRTAMGREWNGKKVYAINRGLNFYELSNVTVPADPNAFTLQVMAAKASLPERLIALANDYAAKVDAMAKEDATRTATEKARTILAKTDKTNLTDKQIVGTVRHRLKVAVAPLLPREAALHQRVKSALDAGRSMAESQNQKIAENSFSAPQEGPVNTLSIRYIPGDELKDCLFVARKGNLQAVVSAAEILDPATQAKIVSTERKTAQKPAELIKDESKPKADNELKEGVEETQPGPLTKGVNGLSADQIKDESKPKADHEMKTGDEPNQPGEVVKRYASAIGAKNVTFKVGEAGSFTAHLNSECSITALAKLWGTKPTLVREAAVAGEPEVRAREHVKPMAGPGDMRHKVPPIAHEDVSKKLAKPQGGQYGREHKSFIAELGNADLATGGEQNWAKKFNELSRTAELKIKALELENDTLKKSLDAVKSAAVEEKKAVVIAALIDRMEKSGALRVDANTVEDYQERGMDRHAAQSKAYAELLDRKRAELKELDLKALETLHRNVSAFAPEIKATAAKSITLPTPSRDDGPSADEDRLASNW